MNRQAMDQAAAILRGGGVMVVPTETFYGLACVATDAAAVARICVLKGRPNDKAMPLIAGNLAQVTRVAHLCDTAQALAQAHWPGPLTLVLKARGPGPAVAPDGTLGIRVSSHPGVRQLAELIDAPLVATSANLSGAPPVAHPDALASEIRDGVDGIWDDGLLPGGLPSTVVRVSRGILEVVRHGAIPQDDLHGY